MSVLSSSVAHTGPDVLARLRDSLQDRNCQSILLVSGREMFAACGAEIALEEVLRGRSVEHVSDFEPNPQAEDVRRLIERLKGQHFDAILAVGGGSVLDVAKLLKAFLAASDPVFGYLEGSEPLEPQAIPLLAIPTTSGSGSEATHFAVLYHQKVKHSIADARLLPDEVFLVADFLYSMPPAVAAASGCDALCQGIESYWSIHSSESSSSLAREAIEKAWKLLADAVIHRTPASVIGMAEAAHAAGRAINQTKTTAPHSVSYALTMHFGIAHGHAVGLLVPSFLIFNRDVAESNVLDPRGTSFVQQRMDDIAAMLGADDCVTASESLLALLRRIGLETDLTQLGLRTAADVDCVVKHGFNPQRVNNNPRRLEEEDLRAMLLERIQLG